VNVVGRGLGWSGELARVELELVFRSGHVKAHPSTHPSAQTGSHIDCTVSTHQLSIMASIASPSPSTISSDKRGGPSSSCAPSPPPVDLPRVLVLDFYDSYTNNLLTLFGHYPDEILLQKVVIIKQDQFNW
jgi:hypothetical protein